MTGDMIHKLASLGPEMVMLTGAVACLVTGLAQALPARRATAWIAAITLATAGLFVLSDAFALHAAQNVQLPAGAAPPVRLLPLYVKGAVVIIGLLLLLAAVGVPDRLRATRDSEARGKPFDPGMTMRGEFWAFFLFSLTGVMLVAGAEDLAWLFLALELTSLPTYVMIAVSRDRIVAQESAVKYFFLGAMAAAVFLFGFALLYGATGTTRLFGPTEGEGVTSIQQYIIDVTRGIPGGAALPTLPPLLIAGVLLSLMGLAFKIAAVPMHFYAADVYEGAATPVTAMLAFVPKTAGFVAMILLLTPLLDAPQGDAGVAAVTWTLWAVAALTMTFGNVLGLLQKSVKRMLAYSSIAHSGYMLVALTAFAGGPRAQQIGAANDLTGGPFGAVLFYLFAYGLGTIGAFAVLACLQRRGEDAETYDDLSGLAKRSPGLAAILLISVLSLIGLPPSIGFLGKVYLFSSAIDAGLVGLVIIALLNSAIGAVYYLRLASVAFFGEPDEAVAAQPATARRVSAAVAACAAVLLGIIGNPLVNWTTNAAKKIDGYELPVATPAPTHDQNVPASDERSTVSVSQPHQASGSAATDPTDQSQ